MVGGVQFDSEEELRKFRAPSDSSGGGLYQFFIKLGLAKNNKEAEKVMMIVAVVAIIIAIVYPFVFG